MSATNARAMRVVVQPASRSGLEKAKPGMEGMTRSKGSPSSGSVSASMTSRNSTNDPGHPCTSSSGSASGWGDRTCRKWIAWPSISVTNCGRAFRHASCEGQS